MSIILHSKLKHDNITENTTSNITSIFSILHSMAFSKFCAYKS